MASRAAVAKVVAVCGCSEAAATVALARSSDLDDALLYLLEDGAASSSPRSSEAGPRFCTESESDAETDSESDDDDEGDELSEDSVDELVEPLEDPYWGELPPDVMQMLGKWLAEHLGRLVVERQITQPEYLHPLRSHADAIDSGHRRVSASLAMIQSIHACRQTCRIWRDEIGYDKVTQVALDGVRCVGGVHVPPRMRGLPSPGGVSSSTLELAQAKQRSMIATWWPGRRVIRPAGWWQQHPRVPSPGDSIAERASFTECAGVPRERCPACREEARPGRVGCYPEFPALFAFMKDCGLKKWYFDVTTGLSVATIADLRQLTAADLLSIKYSGVPVDPATARTFLDRVRSTPVIWTEENLASSPCQECGGSETAEKIICAGCQTLFCRSCSRDRVCADDGRPQDASEILPRDFAARFCNVRDVSMVELLLPSLPPALGECRSLEALDVSKNCMSHLPDWVGDLPALRHLNLSHQARGFQPTQPPTLRNHAAMHPWRLPSATLVTLRLRGLGLTALPCGIRACKSLELLDLSLNRLGAILVAFSIFHPNIPQFTLFWG